MTQPQPLDYGTPEPARPWGRLAIFSMLASVVSPLGAVIAGNAIASILSPEVKDPFIMGAACVCFLAPIGLCVWAAIRARRRRLRGQWWAVAGALIGCFWIYAFFAPRSPHP